MNENRKIDFTTIEKTGLRFVVENNQHFKSVLSKYPEIEKQFSYVKDILDKSVFRDTVQLGIFVRCDRARFILVINNSKKAENKIYAYSGLFKELRNKIKGSVPV